MNALHQLAEAMVFSRNRNTLKKAADQWDQTGVLPTKEQLMAIWEKEKRGDFFVDIVASL